MGRSKSRPIWCIPPKLLLLARLLALDDGSISRSAPRRDGQWRVGLVRRRKRPPLLPRLCWWPLLLPLPSSGSSMPPPPEGVDVRRICCCCSCRCCSSLRLRSLWSRKKNTFDIFRHDSFTWLVLPNDNVTFYYGKRNSVTLKNYSKLNKYAMHSCAHMCYIYKEIRFLCNRWIDRRIAL